MTVKNKVEQHRKEFLDFIRKQGVVGLAVGFILGGSVSQVVSAVVNDLVNPLIAPILGTTKDLEGFVLNLGPFAFKIGHFISVFINFLVIALTVYVGVKILRLDKLDKKEEETG